MSAEWDSPSYIEDAKPFDVAYDLLAFLSYETGIEALNTHLKSEYCEENLGFWLAVQDFLNVPVSDTAEKLKKAAYVRDNYVKPDAPNSVSIPYSMSAEICKKIDEEAALDDELFTEALLTTNEMLGLSSFPRYAKKLKLHVTSVWGKLLEKLNTKVGKVRKDFYPKLFASDPTLKEEADMSMSSHEKKDVYLQRLVGMLAYSLTDSENIKKKLEEGSLGSLTKRLPTVKNVFIGYCEEILGNDLEVAEKVALDTTFDFLATLAKNSTDRA